MDKIFLVKRIYSKPFGQYKETNNEVELTQDEIELLKEGIRYYDDELSASLLKKLEMVK